MEYFSRGNAKTSRFLGLLSIGLFLWLCGAGNDYSHAQTNNQIFVSLDEIQCVAENAETYLSRSNSDTLFVFLEFCPSNLPDDQAFDDLSKNFDPTLPLGDKDREQKFVSLTRLEISCLGRKAGLLGRNAEKGLLDLAAFLERACGS